MTIYSQNNGGAYGEPIETMGDSGQDSVAGSSCSVWRRTVRDPWLWAYVVAVAGDDLLRAVLARRGSGARAIHPPTPALTASRCASSGHCARAPRGRGARRRPAGTGPSVPPGLRAFALVGMAVSIGDVLPRDAREPLLLVGRARADERGHHVVDSGPYSVVRHPGYAGMLLGLRSAAWRWAHGSRAGIGLVHVRADVRAACSSRMRSCRRTCDGYAAYAHGCRTG